MLTVFMCQNTGILVKAMQYAGLVMILRILTIAFFDFLMMWQVARQSNRTAVILYSSILSRLLSETSFIR